MAGYRANVRAQLLPAFGSVPLESVATTMIERWIAEAGGSASARRKSLVLLHGMFRRAKKAWGLPSNPAAEVEKAPLGYSGGIEVFSPEEVWALIRIAAGQQDGPSTSPQHSFTAALAS